MIKNTLAAFVFFVLSLNAFSQSAPFQIKGSITGLASPYKYIYLMDNINNEFIGKTAIENNRFFIRGEYASENRFGALPSGILILSNDSAFADPKLTRSKKYFTRKIIFEPIVEVEYNAINKKFSINGDELNRVQTLFSNIDYILNQKIDSVEKSLKNDGEVAQNLSIQKTNLTLDADSAYLKVIKANYNSHVALSNFSKFVSNQIISLYETIEIYNAFSDEIKQSTYHTRLKKDIENRASWTDEPIRTKLTIGQTMPLFEQLDNNDKLISSEKSMGTYTLIDFWASWCIPCIEEMPYVRKAYEAYREKGFRVIAVSVDKQEYKAKWINSIKNLQIANFTNLISPTAKPGISKTLEIRLIPTNYLIDKNGKIVAVNLHAEQLSEKLQMLLN